ncbi:MAG: hypothetical protein ABI743_11500 [bacterium]
MSSRSGDRVFARGSWGLLLLLLLTTPAYANTERLSGELNLAGGLYSNDADLFRTHPQPGVGFEHFKKWSTDEGDWLTTSLQMRFIFNTEIDNFEPDVMDAYANFRRDNGQANIKVGKFEIPYGLEPVLDTHGTLLQSGNHHNLGTLWDWGVDLNGQLDTVDYQISALTGDFSQIYPHHEQDSWLISGRVGSPRTGEDDAWGLSIAAGHTVPSMHEEAMPHDEHEEMEPEAMDLVRVGGDYTRWAGPATWLAEASVGTDDGDPMASAWARYEYIPLQHDRWKYSLQAEGIWRDAEHLDDFTELSAGLDYQLAPDITVRLMASHAFTNGSGDPDDRLILQYYYFGQ